MKLSTKGRYAVMAMADLADAADSGPVTLSDIASRQSISLSYLEQLFAKLRRADIVSSVRGPGGGYKLSRLPTEIRISDIILAVDEPLRATRCSEAKGCLSDGRRCITHDHSSMHMPRGDSGGMGPGCSPRGVLIILESSCTNHDMSHYDGGFLYSDNHDAIPGSGLISGTVDAKWCGALSDATVLSGG